MDYRSPDVYIKEVSTGPKPIEAVGTSTAGFLGEAVLAGAPEFEAVGISNWAEFRRRFVGDEPKRTTPLIQAVWGFFLNGGTRCYVCNIGKDKTLDKGLKALGYEDEIAIVAAPGFTDVKSYDALLTHCEAMKDRFAILDASAKVDEISQLTRAATDDAAPAAGGGGGGGGAPVQKPGKGPRKSPKGFGAVYYPWIRTVDPILGGDPVAVPPSGHLAGIYARTDANRGVHKAPANEPVKGAIGLADRISRAEQNELNPAGVNCIRYFSDQGILVWGARTVSSDAEWRYVNVRRLFNMIEESIARSTKWVVFEPNDESLWKAIIRDVSAFLTLIWREGMLFGATPAEAFFVKCDAETNTPDRIDAGMVVIQVGIAPVKPAEFVVFEIGQHAGGTEIE